MDVSEPTESRRQVTILFIDLAGSTDLARRLDAETLHRVMGDYYGAARAAVGRHGGHIEKFIGDAVMAVFGFPLANEDDALRVGGTLQVRVLGHNGALTPGLPGVTVTAVRGTDRLAATTDASGCVVFAATDLGDYDVTASLPNYVDFNGNPSVTTRVTTTASDTTSVDLPQIGLAGAINAVFDTRIGSSVIPGQLAPSLSLNNAAMAIFKTTPALAANGSASISTPATMPLFPFIVGATANNHNGNYVVWGGRCTFDQPPAPSTATVAAGATGTPTVRLPALIVNVSHRNATRTTRVTPASIRLTDACGQTWLPPVIPATPTSPNNALGQLRYPGQPYSPSTRRYTVCADFVVGGFRYRTSTTTANDNFTAGTPVNLTIDSRFTSNRGSC